MTEPNWSTQEVDRWLSNDEPLYLRAKRCTSPEEMRVAFTGTIPSIDWPGVDWDYIFDQFEEDRSST